RSSGVARDEIEEWPQEDPDDVDEVPVDGADREGMRRDRPDLAPDHLAEQEREHTHAGEDVERVQAGHAEIQREEHLRPWFAVVAVEVTDPTRVDAVPEVLQ